MKKSRYSEAQIVSVLKEAESGVPVFELCRTHGMSSAAFYQWRSKYGGMDASLISEMKQFELRPVFRTVCLLTLRGHFPSHIFESLFWRFVADA